MAAKKGSAKIVFTKAKLLRMGKYKNRADLLSILLEDDKQYTVSEVDTLIKKFMEGTVK